MGVCSGKPSRWHRCSLRRLVLHWQSSLGCRSPGLKGAKDVTQMCHALLLSCRNRHAGMQADQPSKLDAAPAFRNTVCSKNAQTTILFLLVDLLVLPCWKTFKHAHLARPVLRSSCQQGTATRSSTRSLSGGQRSARWGSSKGGSPSKPSRWHRCSLRRPAPHPRSGLCCRGLRLRREQFLSCATPGQ